MLPFPPVLSVVPVLQLLPSECIPVFLLRYTVRHNTGTGSYEYFSVLGKSKSYSDTGIQVSGKGNIANGSSIDASLIVFQFVDDLTGPKLRCSRQGSCGEDGIHRIQSIRIFPDHALTVDPMCIT